MALRFATDNNAKSQALRKERFKARNHIQVKGNKVETIEYLRKMAELNLCNRCFQVYKECLEPKIQSTIQSLLLRPLGDWTETESEINQMIMKDKGIFKSSSIVYSLGNDYNANATMVDVEAFNEITHWKLNKKINYLRHNGILQDSSYQLLEKARKTRNRIHDPIGFSKQDYDLFHAAFIITHQIWIATIIDQKDTSIWFKTDAEKYAKQWLESQK